MKRQDSAISQVNDEGEYIKLKGVGMVKAKKNMLNRGKLRDVVLLCCFVSALFYGVSSIGTVIGFTMLAAGCFLHVVAKGILIRNVVLCSGGIYGIVRHPYYLANYLIDSSFCVLSGNSYLLLAYPFLFFWSYGPTLREEETLLKESYGNAFVNDSLTVPQVFPDTGSLRRLGRLFEGFSPNRITVKECARVTRFLSVGFAVTLIHQLKPEGLSGVWHLLLPTRHDYSEFLLALLAAVLFAISSALVMSKYNSRAEGERVRQGLD
jgi:protein-S-isoprenylcysteine O-methyltransferase Ste14